MESKQDELLFLVQAKYPNECSVLGLDIVQELIQDCLDGWTDQDVDEAYQDDGEGFSFNVVESIKLVFSGIQVLKTIVDLIDRRKKKEAAHQLHDEVLKALLDNGIDQQKAEEYCKKYIV